MIYGHRSPLLVGVHKTFDVWMMCILVGFEVVNYVDFPKSD